MNTSQVTSTAAASHGALPIAMNGARQSLSRMPASIALAIGFGIAATRRAERRPQTGQHDERADRDEGRDRGREIRPRPRRWSRAAPCPGVLQAIEIGMRSHQLSAIATTPLSDADHRPARRRSATRSRRPPTRPWIRTATELA